MRTDYILFAAAPLFMAATIAASTTAPGGSDGSQSARTKAIGTVREIMLSMTAPMSDAVFAAGAEAPKDENAWRAVRRQAFMLAESANLLVMPDRAPEVSDWTELAVAQRDAAVAAMQAADKKDAEALTTSADALYETCSNCHKKYRPN